MMDLFKKNFVGNNLSLYDPKFVKKLAPIMNFVEAYFRYKVVGLDNIPERGPALVVMNHGIIPYHGFLLTKKLSDKDVQVRGLGASFLFMVPGLKEFFSKGGAVNASPKNAIRLLKAKNIVLLAPGGIYEGLVTHPGMDRIPWERRTGFVKIAIRTETPIVPTFCPGINNAYYNSKLFLKQRIKILEAIRFSMPLFFGIGLLPFPVELVHYVGKPISVKKKRGETEEAQVKRIHQEVIDSMRKLAMTPGGQRTTGRSR